LVCLLSGKQYTSQKARFVNLIIYFNMLNIILNLLPKGFLNPSIPSLAVGAALAAAVFRFDFLKEPPGSTEPALQQDIIAERRSQVVSSLIFGLMAVLILQRRFFCRHSVFDAV